MTSPATSTAIPYALTRLGVVMAPQPGDPLEAEGVLNPASGRTPDGRLHLLPRIVAEGNVSRVGLAEVTLTDGGTAILPAAGDGGVPGLPCFTIPTALPSGMTVPSSMPSTIPTTLPSGIPTTLPSGFKLPTFPTATASH